MDFFDFETLNPYLLAGGHVNYTTGNFDRSQFLFLSPDGTIGFTETMKDYKNTYGDLDFGLGIAYKELLFVEFNDAYHLNPRHEKKTLITDGYDHITAGVFINSIKKKNQPTPLQNKLLDLLK